MVVNKQPRHVTAATRQACAQPCKWSAVFVPLLVTILMQVMVGTARCQLSHPATASDKNLQNLFFVLDSFFFFSIFIYVFLRGLQIKDTSEQAANLCKRCCSLSALRWHLVRATRAAMRCALCPCRKLAFTLLLLYPWADLHPQTSANTGHTDIQHMCACLSVQILKCPPTSSSR